jgi:hypothetical protein
MSDMNPMCWRWITIAIALLMTTSAYATDATLPLTDPLIGHWCPIKDDVYKRGLWECSGNLLIKQDGYADEKVSCEFLNVKRLPEKNGYTIHANCANNEVHTTGNFWIVNNLLHLRTFSRGHCAVVFDNMPDGFLNLRVGPGSQYAVKAKLITGDKLFKVGEESRDGNWIRVSVPRLNDIDGWVNDGFIQHVNRCSELE